MTIGRLFIETDLILAGISLVVMLFGLFGLIVPILTGLVINGSRRLDMESLQDSTHWAGSCSPSLPY